MEAENRAQEKKEEGNTEKNKESSQKKCLPVLWKNSSTLRKWLPVFGVAAAFGILLGIVYGINAGSGAAEEVPVPGDMKETVSESQPEPVEENHIVLSEEMKQPEKLAETSDDEQGTSTGEDMNRVDEEGEGISVSKSEPAPTLSAIIWTYPSLGGADGDGLSRSSHAAGLCGRSGSLGGAEV